MIDAWMKGEIHVPVYSWRIDGRWGTCANDSHCMNRSWGAPNISCHTNGRWGTCTYGSYHANGKCVPSTVRRTNREPKKFTNHKSCMNRMIDHTKMDTSRSAHNLFVRTMLHFSIRPSCFSSLSFGESCRFDFTPPRLGTWGEKLMGDNKSVNPSWHNGCDRGDMEVQSCNSCLRT